MPMIQGIDGSALLAAFRQGRSDRSADDNARAAEERQAQIGGVMAGMFGDQGGGGVAGQYAPSQPAKRPTMGEAFNPQAMGQIGAMDAGGAAPAAMTPPAAARQPQANMRPDPMQLARLIALDPKVGGEIASAFKSMNEDQIKMASAKNDIMGSAAQYIAQGKTPEERMQRFQHAAPQLQAMGWTAQELDGVDNDLSDNALQGYQALAIANDNRIDNELAERKFRAGDNVSIQAGGNVVNVKPDGSARYVVAQPGVGGDDVPGNIPPEAINALKSGEGSAEQFDAIFGAGAAARVMGGGVSNDTGGFPPGG